LTFLLKYDIINQKYGYCSGDFPVAVREVMNMSFLSKLFGGAAPELSGLLKDIADANKKNEKPSAGQTDSQPAPVQTEQMAEPSPSGWSWGEEMPDEENQYSYSGSYGDYFSHVFSEEFPDLRIERAIVSSGRSEIFTLWNGGDKKLVVELLSRNSSAEKLRRDCRREGVPYLRFYYDYHGWWNTRSYVAERSRKAMSGC